MLTPTGWPSWRPVLAQPGPGAGPTTLNDREAGVSSALPRASTARTKNVYAPSASGPTTCGEPHDCSLPEVAPGPSSRQRKPAPASSDVNANDGVVESVGPLGPSVIVVSGGVTSSFITNASKSPLWVVSTAPALVGKLGEAVPPTT